MTTLKNRIKSGKILGFVLIPFLVFAGISGAFSQDIEITNPGSGDRFVIDTTVFIEWTGVEEDDLVRLEYSLNGGADWTKLTDSATGFSYEWEVPDVESEHCLVRGTLIEPDKVEYTALNLHERNAVACEWSPDGRTLLTSCEGPDSNLTLWNGITYDPIFDLAAHDTTVNTVGWKADGTEFASGGADSMIVVWDASDGTEIARFDRSGEVNCLAWHPVSNELIYSLRWDENLYLFDPASPGSLHSIPLDKPIDYFRISPDGTKISVVSDKENFLRIVDFDDETYFDVKADNNYVYTTCWSGDGGIVATGGYDQKIRMWNPVNGELLDSLPKVNYSIGTLSWSPDGKTFAGSGTVVTISVWDVPGDALIDTLWAHTGYVSQVRWHPNSTKLASVASGLQTLENNKTIVVWNFEIVLAQDVCDGEFEIYEPDPIPGAITLRAEVAGPASPGETTEISVYLDEIAFMNPQTVENFSVALNFNKSLLIPINPTPSGIEDGDLRSIRLDLPNAPEVGLLGTYSFKAALGDAETCDVFLDAATAEADNDSITFTYAPADEFLLNGICREGGDRLFSESGTLYLNQCSPNPATDFAEITFGTIEKGFTRIAIYDMMGALVSVVFEEDVQSGERIVGVDLSSVPSGVYVYRLETPTQTLTRTMVIQGDKK